MNPELITKIVEAVVTVLLLLVSAYVIPWLKGKIGDDKYNMIVEFAEIVVRSAEKLYSKEDWMQKKEYAMNLVLEKIDAIGIELSYEEVNAIVEGAVQAVKENLINVDVEKQNV